MRMASGLPDSTRWSPHTPLSTASAASRSLDAALEAGSKALSAPSDASTPWPTSLVPPRTPRYTAPVMPLVRPAADVPMKPMREAMV